MSPNAFTLILETSTERGLVAIAKGETLIASRELPFGYHNSKNLIPVIDELLGEQRPDCIIVGVGPGSYTGIRIGAVAAKTFSFAWGIPIYPVSTLAAFCKEGAAILDAKISGVYLMLPGGEPFVCPLENVPEKLGEITTLVTPHAARLKEKLPGPYHWIERGPDPLLMLQSATHSVPHSQLELLYLRKTQAELELL